MLDREAQSFAHSALREITQAEAAATRKREDMRNAIMRAFGHIKDVVVVLLGTGAVALAARRERYQFGQPAARRCPTAATTGLHGDAGSLSRPPGMRGPQSNRSLRLTLTESEMRRAPCLVPSASKSKTSRSTSRR